MVDHEANLSIFFVLQINLKDKTKENIFGREKSSINYSYIFSTVAKLFIKTTMYASFFKIPVFKSLFIFVVTDVYFITA